MQQCFWVSQLLDTLLIFLFISIVWIVKFPLQKYLVIFLDVLFQKYHEMHVRHLNKNADDFEATCKSLDITER